MSKTTFSLFATLIVLSFIIENTYKAGIFYRDHLHDYVVEYTLKALALSITIGQYVYQGGKYVYTNRKMIMDKAGSYFVYESPTVAY